jgi:hypothetical protein
MLISDTNDTPTMTVHHTVRKGHVETDGGILGM